MKQEPTIEQDQMALKPIVEKPIVEKPPKIQMYSSHKVKSILPLKNLFQEANARNKQLPKKVQTEEPKTSEATHKPGHEFATPNSLNSQTTPKPDISWNKVLVADDNDSDINRLVDLITPEAVALMNRPSVWKFQSLTPQTHQTFASRNTGSSRHDVQFWNKNGFGPVM